MGDDSQNVEGATGPGPSPGPAPGPAPGAQAVSGGAISDPEQDADPMRAKAETLKYMAFCRSQHDAIGNPWQGDNLDSQDAAQAQADAHNSANSGHNAYVLSQQHPR